MNNNVKKFYSLLMKSPEDINKVQEELGKVKNKKDLMNFIEIKVIPLAREKGFEFTKEDLLSYESEAMKKLSEEDLLSVSGGISFRNKKIVSLFLTGISFSSNLKQTVRAGILKDVIMEATKGIEDATCRKLREQAGDGGEAEENQIISQEQGGLSERKIRNSIGEIFETASEETDMQYMLDALNLLDPYIYNLTGTTSNFRFYDGYKQEISTVEVQEADRVPRWDYKKDKGEGSPNFMRCLFPSSGGALGDRGGFKGVENFSKDCNPTPDLIAKILGYIHNYIRTDSKDASRSLNELIDELKKGRYNKNLQKKVNKFLNEYSKITIPKNYKANIKYVYTILFLLKNSEIMIKNQEEDGQSVEKILPKYTAERMIMSYFIKHFNNERDIKLFYEEAKKTVKSSPNKVDLERLKESRERLENINKIFKKIKVNENSPYKEKLQEHGDAKRIQKLKEGGVQFINKTFSDCADITSRHVMNLLIYNNDKKWDDVVKEADVEKEDYDEILKAINNNGKFLKELTLKERLKLFFYYQLNHENGADAVDVEARSFWNYVISNMDSNVEGGMYKIKYFKECNELESGFLNMLKLVYNMAFALKGESEDSKKAKGEIDKLENMINCGGKDGLNDVLKSAIESTMGLIKRDIKVSSLRNIEVKGKECFGEVKINDFIVCQYEDHAKITFNPILTDEFTESESTLKTFLERDNVAQLLSKSFNLDLGEIAKISDFNDLFCFGKEKCNHDTQFFKNFKLLKFLKCIQGEEENNVRIFNLINKYCAEANVKVNHDFGNEVPVCMFIFKNYIKTKDDFETLLPGQKLNDVLKKNLSTNIFTSNGIKFYYMINEGSKNDITVWPLLENNEEEITIPSSIEIKGKVYNVSNIGKFTFLNNKNLKKVKIEGQEGQHLTIGISSFANSSVEEVEILGNIERLTIKEEAFKNLFSLRKFNMPSSIKELEIGSMAFQEAGIIKFEVPEKVENLVIGEQGFYQTRLKSFIVSKNVKKLDIYEKAFCNVEEFELFEIPENAGIKELNVGGHAFSNNKLTEFKVPASVEKLFIGHHAFTEAKQLISFKIADGVKGLNIGEHAFFGTSLNEIEIPASVERLTIHGGTVFGKEFFENEEGIYPVRLSKNFKRLKMLNSIKELTIGEYAFSDVNIRNFEVPKVVERLTIQEGAFDGTEHLKTFEIPEGVKELTICKDAFINSSLTVLKVPVSVQKLNVQEGALGNVKLERPGVLDNFISKFLNWLSKR